MAVCYRCGATYSAEVDLCPLHGVSLCDPADLERVGQAVGGYVLDKILGVGGMGVVYQARHLALGKQVAIKILNERFVHRQHASQEMLREAQAASRIRHPNIVDITDYGSTADGAAFFVMELLEGQSLGQVLLRDKRLEPHWACAITWQIASALQAAHAAGIVHRDLKPENIFLLPELTAVPAGSCERVKLLDFGLAKVLDMEPSSRTRAGMLAGTPWYMSPEQARNRTLDGRSDLYSLGVLLYLMLSGELPFTGPSAVDILMAHVTLEPVPPSVRWQEVDGELECIVLTCLEKEPEARYPQMSALAAALENWMVRQVPLARKASRVATSASETTGLLTKSLPQVASQPTVTSELMGQVLGAPGLALRSDVDRVRAPELLSAQALQPGVPAAELLSAQALQPGAPASASAPIRPSLPAQPPRPRWPWAVALGLIALTVALVLAQRGPSTLTASPAVSLEIAPQAEQPLPERQRGLDEETTALPGASPVIVAEPLALSSAQAAPEPAAAEVAPSPQSQPRARRPDHRPKRVARGGQPVLQPPTAGAPPVSSPLTPTTPTPDLEARHDSTPPRTENKPETPAVNPEPPAGRYRSWVLDPFAAGR